MNETIQPDSLVTLHYRISLENGQPLISTFDGNPATLQLGSGEMLPALEAPLIGLEAGTVSEYTLPPAQAFGLHNPELIEQVRREHIPDAHVEPMSIMEFVAPDGSKYSGLVTSVDDDSAQIDFNHPLAGKTIRFEVKVIGVL